MDGRARKEVAAARLLRGDKLVRRFVFHLICQLQADCDPSDNDTEQWQVPEDRGVEFHVKSSKIRKMVRSINKIVTIATRKNT